MLGEQIDGMGVAKNQCGSFLAKKTGEARQSRLIHVQGVQIILPIQQSVAKETAPAARTKLRIAPDFGDGLAESPATPLVRAQDAGALPLPAVFIQKDLQGDPRGTGGLLP